MKNIKFPLIVKFSYKKYNYLFIIAKVAMYILRTYYIVAVCYFFVLNPEPR